MLQTEGRPGGCETARCEAGRRPQTRIQREKQEVILEAALDVFSLRGFPRRHDRPDRRSGGDEQAEPALLFPSKEEIYKRLMTSMLDLWLGAAARDRFGGRSDPGAALLPPPQDRDERATIRARAGCSPTRCYRARPHAIDVLETDLKALVDEKAHGDRGLDAGRQDRRTDPYHLIFSIWATTQHYADFDVQVRAVLGKDRGGEGRFEDAARYLENLFLVGLLPKDKA